MKGTSRFVTILLAVLSVVCVLVAGLFIRNETRLATERQKTVAKLSAELEPINEERNEWQSKDDEWQKSIAEKQKGKTCILLCFDSLNDFIYDTAFNKMDEYGFKGTFSLKNGVIPGSEESAISSDKFHEMLDSGWEYAISFGESNPDSNEESSEENEQETETVDEYGVKTGTEWLDQIDSFRQRLEENELSVPGILFCSSEQYDSVTEEELENRGFQMIQIQSIDGFPTIDLDEESSILKFEGGFYTQRSDLGSNIEQAVQKGESLVININNIVRISKNSDYDLTTSKFDSLLSQLKNFEEQEMLNVFTFSEYSEYIQKEKKEYKKLLAEYGTFRTEMNDKMQELDNEEQKLVEEAKEATGSN